MSAQYNPLLRDRSLVTDLCPLRSRRDLADENEPRAATLVGCSDADAIRLNCVSATLP